MERKAEQNLLYDFYGQLLTEHQKSVYEDYVYNDLSLSELAEEYQISRQGAHDLVKRCDHILQNYEDKLQLVAKFLTIKTKLAQLQDLSVNTGLSREELLQYVRQLSDEILNEL